MNLDKFLPNENNKRLFPFFVAFCIAVIGGFAGFIGAYFSIKVLSYAAFIVTAAGVFGGFICIVYGWYAMLFRRPKRND